MLEGGFKTQALLLLVGIFPSPPPAPLSRFPLLCLFIHGSSLISEKYVLAEMGLKPTSGFLAFSSRIQGRPLLMFSYASKRVCDNFGKSR